MAEEGEELPTDLDGDTVLEGSVTMLAHAFCNIVNVDAEVGDFGMGERGDSRTDLVS